MTSHANDLAMKGHLLPMGDESTWDTCLAYAIEVDSPHFAVIAKQLERIKGHYKVDKASLHAANILYQQATNLLY